MKLSRPCYDKPHRCPGWVGGGTRSARVDRCVNGSIHVLPSMRYLRKLTAQEDWRLDWNTHPGAHPFRFGHCVGGVVNAEGGRSEPCGITTWPYVTRWVDPRYVLGWKVGGALRRLRWRWQDR